jgi:hypothetical protein
MSPSSLILIKNLGATTYKMMVANPVAYESVYPIFLMNESFLPNEINKNQMILLEHIQNGSEFISYGVLTAETNCLTISPNVSTIEANTNGK